MLALVSTSAMAEWTLVDWNDELSAFINNETIRKDGDKVKVWTLLNYNSIQGEGKYKYKSQKTQHQYDCKKEQFRIIASITYSEKMGEGNNSSIFNSSNDEWNPIPPDSIVENSYKIACGKK